MGPENATSTEILRPPMTSSVTGSILQSDEGDSGSLASKVSEQEEEIKELKSEVRKLRQCVKGVHLIGRKLQKSTEENSRLKRSLSNNLNHQENDGLENDEEDKTKVNKSEVKPDEDNSLQYHANSSDECSDDDDDDDESSSSEEEEENSSDSEKESGSLDADVDTDQESDEFCAANVTVVRNTNTSSKNVQELSTENVKLRQQIEELRAAKEAEGYHYVTSVEANELQKTATKGSSNSVGSDTDDLGWEKRYKELEIENAEHKATVKEIKNVNHKWDQFWKDKKSDYDARLKGKGDEISKLHEEIAGQDAEIQTLKDIHAKKDHEHDASIMKMERVITVVETEKESILKEKEEMLLVAKQRIDKNEGTIEKLQSDLSKEQQKCEQSQKYARILLKQKKELEDEIKRLNGTLTEKCEENSLLRSIDPKMASTAEIQQMAAEGSLSRPSGLLIPPPNMCMSGQGLIEKILDRQPARYQRSSAPSGAEHGELMDEEEKSLSKDELKEKVELYREQTHAFESDFKRERRDREAVVGQLDSVKRELRETKAILHNAPKPPSIYNYRQKDVQIHDPLLHELHQGYQRQDATHKYHYQNKRDNLIAHGHSSSSKTKERSSKSRREPQRQHRHFNDLHGYEREIFDDEEEQYHVCRCPKHNCYIPAGKPMNNLSKPHSAY